MLTIMREEFKKIFTNPKIYLVLILAPLFFTFVIAGVYVKTYIFDLPVAVLDLDKSALSRTVIREFDNSPYFKVTHHVDDRTELEELIKGRRAFAGLVFPHEMFESVREREAPKILFLVDGTNMVIGNNAYARGAEILNTLNAGLQIKMLQSKGMVPGLTERVMGSFSFTQRILYDPALSYLCYLFIGVMGIFVQQTLLAALVPNLMADARFLVEKGGTKRLFIKLFYMGSISFVTYCLCLLIVHKVFHLPFEGSPVNVFLIVALFIINLSAPAVLIAALTGNTLRGIQFCMFLSVPTFLTSGYVWPEYMMPDFLRVVIKSLWPLIYYAVPARDVIIKGATFTVIRPYLLQGALYGLFWIPFAVFVFRRRFKNT